MPEFAGFYFDRAGSLVVLTTDASRGDLLQRNTREVLRGRVFDGRRGLTADDARLSTRLVRYSYGELAKWRRAILAAAPQLTGPFIVDLDEYRNTVTVGLQSAEDRRVLVAAAHAGGVPDDALVVEQVQIVDDSGWGGANPLSSGGDALRSSTLMTGADSLTLYNRPVEGGMQITYNRVNCWPTNCAVPFVPPGEKQCAFALGVGYGSPEKAGFLTNSHCSEELGSTTAQTTYHQPFIAGTANLIGTESVDPPYTSCAPSVCRAADVLFATFDSSAASAISLGTIARTTFWGTPLGSATAYGSIRIDSLKPRLYVKANAGNPQLNESVDKMGPVTGWTGGTVLATCVTGTSGYRTNSPVTWYYTTCATETSYARANGDSGSPVFKYSAGSDSVSFMGIHFGAISRNGGPFRGLYSSIGRIQMDLPTSLRTY